MRGSVAGRVARARRLSVAIVIGVAVLVGVAPAGAAATAYPSTSTVAAGIKKQINDSAQAHHYVWRASARCANGASAGSMTCRSVGRWAFGFGRVMDHTSWNVVANPDGTWTASSLWTLSG
jgi:hypothetical protein